MSTLCTVTYMYHVYSYIYLCETSLTFSLNFVNILSFFFLSKYANGKEGVALCSGLSRYLGFCIVSRLAYRAESFNLSPLHTSTLLPVGCSTIPIYVGQFVTSLFIKCCLPSVLFSCSLPIHKVCCLQFFVQPTNHSVLPPLVLLRQHDIHSECSHSAVPQARCGFFYKPVNTPCFRA